ncbi:DoxX family protein [Ornithinibacillus xuwenensis]|uniref:DoxX family protein n=1 Tax=Ornithinibacillus xuwenensis TaxID=3144668 RepID=A0ABU9XEW5_9BACI
MQLNTANWICYAIGYVFITSGVMKLVMPEFRQTFFNLGLPFPESTLLLIAIIELACGALIIGRMYVRQAVIPLIIIMLGAIYLTKFPILMKQGIVSFAFHARLDIVMLILLFICWKHIRGKTF